MWVCFVVIQFFFRQVNGKVANKKTALAEKVLKVYNKKPEKKYLEHPPHLNKNKKDFQFHQVFVCFCQVCPGIHSSKLLITPGVLRWKCRKLLSTEELEQLHVTSAEAIPKPIGSMGLVYLPTFAIKINHSCR